MPTVVELKAIIKKHQAKNCQKFTGLKKAELLKIVSRIKRVRTQREIGVSVIKKKKALKKSSFLKEGKDKSISKIKPLTAPKKTFTSKGSIAPASMKISTRRKMSAAENKRYNTIIASAPKKWRDFVKNLLTKLTPSQKNDFKVTIASIKMNQVINYIQSVAAAV